MHGNCHWKSGCRIGQCGSMTAYMSMMTANWVVTQDGMIPGSVIRVWSSCMFRLPSFSLHALVFLTSLRRQCVRSSSNQVTGHPRVRPLKAVQTIYDSASVCTLAVLKQFSLAICTGVWKQFSLAHWQKKRFLQTGADSSLCKQLDYGFFSVRRVSQILYISRIQSIWTYIYQLKQKYKPSSHPGKQEGCRRRPESGYKILEATSGFS